MTTGSTAVLRDDVTGAGPLLVVRADARRLPLPDASVDLICTSPPYWMQRTYTDGGQPVPGQIGQEPDGSAYLTELLAATAEWARVLKPAGSLWVNLGDRYLPRGRGLSLLPQRYAIGCADQLGLVVRAEVVWSKPSAMPEGKVTDRAHRTHETWVHLTREGACWADLDPLRTDRLWTRSEGYQGHKPRKAEGQKAHNWTSDGNPLGRPPGTVWTIPSEPFPAGLSGLGHLDGHTAAFPVEWPRRIVLGWCPPDGTVLDPFGGTGTTAHVASALGRVGISVDLSAAYCQVAATPALAARRRQKALTGRPAVYVPPGATTPELF